jgi:multicomponent Na+:H+ antiporter subunit E
MPLQPALQEYRTTLSPGLPRVLFANVVSLLPGTLSADIDGASLQIHVLDERAANIKSLRELEAAVARLLPRN